MSKTDQLGFKILGLVALIGLVDRFLGLQYAFGLAVTIAAVAFWKIFEDKIIL